jgi:hypothetical protein
VPWQPGKTEAAADKRGRRGKATNGPALLGAEPADVPWLLAAGVANHHLHLGLQILKAQFAIESMQRVIGMGDGDELDVAQFRTEVTGNAQASDGQVGHTFEQHFLDTRQHFLAQTHAATATLRHERGQRADNPRTWIGGVDHQPNLGFPTLFHVMGEIFQLAGLFHQLSRTTQQHAAGLGEHGFTPIDAQQRHAELVLHTGDGVTHRRLRTVQGLGGLGESAVVDHGLQCSPLIQGHAGRFHQ